MLRESGFPSLQQFRCHGAASNELTVFLVAFRPSHPHTSMANVVSVAPENELQLLVPAKQRVRGGHFRTKFKTHLGRLRSGNSLWRPK